MSVNNKIIPQEIIRLKRDGQVLDGQAINGFVSGLVDGNFSDSQVGAWRWHFSAGYVVR